MKRTSDFSSIAIAIISFACIASIAPHHSATAQAYPLTDITSEAGLDSARGSRIWLADINNDGYPDLLWGDGLVIKNKLHIYLNVPNPDIYSTLRRVFIDFTEQSGANANRDPEKTGRIVDIAALADINNDGNLDIVTSIYYHRLQYYQDGNDPGDRTEVLLGDGTGKFSLALNSGLNSLTWSPDLPEGLINATGLSFLDYDYDGNIDLYIATWWKDYAIESKLPDMLFKGNGDGSFSPVSMSAINLVSEPMYGVNVTDWDNDGWQDIVTSPYCRSGGSLFRNMQNGRFADYTNVADYGAQKMGGDNGQNLCQWEANPGDFDGDGNMDLLQVSVHGGYHAGEGRTTAVRNLGAERNYKLVWEIDRIERDAPLSSHLGDQGGCWLDVDGDGRLDVAIGQMAYPQANTEGQERLYICRQNDKGIFKDMSKEYGVFHFKEGHSVEPADFDLDGDQDIFFSRQVRDTTYVDSLVNGEWQKVRVINNYIQITLLRNDFRDFYKTDYNWSSIKLTAPENSNQSSLGARITVYSGDVEQPDSQPLIQTLEIQAGLGHFAGQQPFIRNFGLGARNRIDSIKVRFPRADLKTATIYNPPLNSILEIDSANVKAVFKNWEDKAPLIAFSTAWLDMGSVDTGRTALRNFSVLNIGDAPLTIFDYDMRVGEEYIISVTDTIPFVIQPGDSKHFTVRFLPTFRKYYPAKVRFRSNAFNGSSRYFEVGGAGFAPAPVISVSSNALDFGTKNNNTINTLKMDLSNIGEHNLKISEIELSAESSTVFSLIIATTPLELEPRESITFDVRFAPTDNYKYSDYRGELIIKSNDYRQSAISVPLKAIGYGPYPIINIATPLTLFGQVPIGESREKAILLENKGDAELVITEIEIEDNAPQIYFVEYPQLPHSIAPGATDSVVVRFSPDKEGALNRRIIFRSNAPDDPEKNSTLRGSGVKGTSVNFTEARPKGINAEISPNPLDEFAVVKLTVTDDSKGKIKMYLTDAEGRIVIDYIDGRVGAGESIYALRGCCIPQGAYFLVVIADDGYLRIPVLIVR